jgi:hypothetical protein
MSSIWTSASRKDRRCFSIVSPVIFGMKSGQVDSSIIAVYIDKADSSTKEGRAWIIITYANQGFSSLGNFLLVFVQFRSFPSWVGRFLHWACHFRPFISQPLHHAKRWPQMVPNPIFSVMIIAKKWSQPRAVEQKRWNDGAGRTVAHCHCHALMRSTSDAGCRKRPIIFIL